MKVAFVVNTCWNIYKFRKGLVQVLLKQGNAVTVIAPEDKYRKEVEAWGVKVLTVSMDRQGIKPHKDFLYFLQLLSVLKKEKPDIILSFTIKSNIYASFTKPFLGIPILCNVSGLGTIIFSKSWLSSFGFLMYRWAFSFSSFVFFQNKNDREDFLRRCPIDKTKTDILPGSGINLVEIQTQPLKKSLVVNFLMAARLIIDKGVREYAQVAKHFINDERVKFTLIGDLDENHPRTISKAELEEWTSTGIVHYHRHTDGLIDMMKEYEVFVLPSYREGCSRFLLEGLALGKALIVSDVPGCRELVEPQKNGFIFDIKKNSDFIKQVERYLQLSYEEKKRYATYSREIAETKFDEQIVLKSYLSKMGEFLE